MATARVLVLVFSASANCSPQVRCEVKLAEDRQVPVLAFRIAVFEDLTPPTLTIRACAVRIAITAPQA